MVRRLRDVLIPASDIRGVVGPPGWRVHQRSGNWRLTFDIRQGEICNLDLEDDH